MMIAAYAIGGDLSSFLSALGNFMYILYMMFSATGHALWWNIDMIRYAIEVSGNILVFTLNLGFIITPLIAAIITGRINENRIQNFTGFFLTVIICMLICIILVYNGFAILVGGTLNQSEAIINVILGSVVNGVIYGLVALALTKK